MTKLSFRRFRAVAAKEFLHVIRDWRSLTLALAIPALLILLFGYALDMDLDDVPVVVWDQSHSPRSRELLSLFDGSPYFTIVAPRDSYRDVEDALWRGDAMVAIVVPGDFADLLEAGRPATVQVLADGSDANTARLALGYATALGLVYDRHLAARALEFRGASIGEPPVALEPRAWYNAGLRSQNAILPGILALVMVVIAAMLTSVTVAREWEMGTMEQLLSTPIRGPEFVFGKVVPYFTVGMIDVALAVILGRWLFNVPLRGNAALVFAMAAVFLTGALFFGLMLSIVLKSQVLANQAALLGSYIPTLMLSGFVFAIENMPTALQALSAIIPGRYYIAILRGIYLKGIGLEILWLNALLLGVYALVMVSLAVKRMSLKLE